LDGSTVNASLIAGSTPIGIAISGNNLFLANTLLQGQPLTPR
jgi:hypothetical protein